MPGGRGERSTRPAPPTTLALVLVTTLLPACIPTGTGPDESVPPQGAIIYAAAGRSSMDLWTIPPGGGSPLRLTRSPRAHEFDPVWSPGGDRIAFARRQPGSTSSDVWVMKADGTEERLTHDVDGPIDRQPAWSPDGRRIVWVRSFPLRSASELWVMRWDGSGQRRLLPGSHFHYDSSPDWSPDGRHVAFTSNRTGGLPSIYTVKSDGSDLHRVTKGSAMAGDPAWSPDGSRILFTRRTVSGDMDLWLVTTDGSRGTRLTTGAAGEAQPAWAPTGERVVFNRYPPAGGPTDLVVTTIAGSHERLVTHGSTVELAPDWGPSQAYPVPRQRKDVQLPTSVEGTASTPDVPANMRSTAVTKGVQLDRFRAYGSDVHVLDVRLDGEATVDVALATGELAGRKTTSRIAAQHGALAAVNGDFAHPSGKPLHPFAEDGDLELSTLDPSTNFAISEGHGDVYFGRPVEQLMLSRPAGGSWLFDRWNSGVPSFDETAAYSPAATEEDRPPKWACSVRLLPVGKRRWGHNRHGVARDFRVDVVTCRESRLGTQEGVVLAARPTSEGAFALSSLRVGERVTLTWSFGWRGVADSIGGFPLLVRDGQVRVRPCEGLLCQLHPRTGVGVTSDRHLLLVVVDGRQEDSRGLTLLEFARLFRDLGALHALNLDGGGSSTMVVRGAVVNDPSGPFERPTSSALLILDGKDEGQVIRSP